MKVVILAGGFGTRLSEETTLRPKPMVEIGGYPILWHIMKRYAAYGLNDFIICCGYKADSIKRYFTEYLLINSDIKVNLATRDITYLQEHPEDWQITLIDTGVDTLTGGRVKRIAPYLDDGPFCLTYGDGVADVNIRELVEFHRRHGKLATITAVPSPGRFGILNVDQRNNVLSFTEKPNNEMGWINGGYFVLEPSVLDFIDGDQTSWEREPLERLARDGHLAAFRHTGFWKPMDTLRDKHELEELWQSGNAVWNHTN